MEKPWEKHYREKQVTSEDIATCDICSRPTIVTLRKTFCEKCKALLCATCQELGHTCRELPHA